MASPSLLMVATAALLLVWIALAGWILANRAIHDRRRAQLRRDVELLAAGALRLELCSTSRLWRLADGEHGQASRAGARELVRRDSHRLLRLGAGGGFRRIHALRVLARGGSPFALTCLREARRSGRDGIVGGVVAVAAELAIPEADELLLDVLVEGDHPRSRTATLLEGRVQRLVPELVELASNADPVLRYWALMLFAHAPPAPAIVAAAVRGGTDSDARVRSAAARLLGLAGSQDALLVLRGLLKDDVFFVRAHAARAAGRLGAPALAREVAGLLADRNWWVRAAAKDSLLALGDSGFFAAVAALQHDDAFARDSAAEVISNSGRLGGDETVLEVGASPLISRIAG